MENARPVHGSNTLRFFFVCTPGPARPGSAQAGPGVVHSAVGSYRKAATSRTLRANRPTGIESVCHLALRGRTAAAYSSSRMAANA